MTKINLEDGYYLIMADNGDTKVLHKSELKGNV